MAYILVVDDDEDIGKATAMILREFLDSGFSIPSPDP